MPAFRFPTAFSVSNGQHWSEVAVGLTTRVSTTTSPPAFGVEGELQNSSLGPDEIRVGDGIPWPSGTSVLWAPPLEVRVEVAPVNGSAPLAVTCSAVISGGTGSYPTLRWAFGDGSTETSATPRHVYGSAGQFEVSLAITDSQGERANSTPVVVHVTEGSGAPSARPGVSPELIAAIAGASVAILGIVVLWRWKHRGRPR